MFGLALAINGFTTSLLPPPGGTVYTEANLIQPHPSENFLKCTSMVETFNLHALMEFAYKSRELYACAAPFPHITLDASARVRDIEACSKAFPQFNDPRWFTYPATDRTQRNKQVMWDMAHMPSAIVKVISELNSRRFVGFLETLTGIPRLIPDPQLYGGGMHQVGNGGLLEIHVDHDFNPQLNLYRRVSVLLYVSHWLPEYGGQLELWEGYRDGDHQDHLIRCVETIVPEFNKMVIFTNSESAYHGFPRPIKCPSGLTRKSLAVYYFSEDPDPSYSEVEHHRARFIPLPGTEISIPVQQWYQDRARI